MSGAKIKTIPPFPSIGELFRHRVKMLCNTLRTRWHPHRDARIIITSRQHADNAIVRAFRFTKHQISFGRIPPGGGDFALAIPATLESVLEASQDEELCKRNPLPIPSESVISLCDNKAALNQRLVENGFGDYIPGPARPGEFPYVLKKIHGCNSSGLELITNIETEMKYSEAIASEDFFLQEWVRSKIDYTAHILFYDQSIKHMATTQYTLADEWGILGKDKLVGKRESDPQFAEIFTAILQSIGFQGLCCIDYRIKNELPQICEINPRISHNLTTNLLAFVRAMDWKRSD